MSKDRHIVIHKAVSLLPSDFYSVAPNPNVKERPMIFHKGQVLRVIPTPEQGSAIEPNTIPLRFADIWTASEGNIASEYTADAIAKATTAIEKENKMVKRAHELIEGGD